MQFRSNQFSAPEVVKNLIIINALFLLAKFVLPGMGYNLDDMLGLFYFESSYFKPWQLVSHFFMHGDLMHLFFNMFALWMFGSKLEQIWGAKRFLNFYVVTALGAVVLHTAVIYFQVQDLKSMLSSEAISVVLNEGRDLMYAGKVFTNETMHALNGLVNTPVVGASGAVFGILAAFAMYWPNTELMLLFIPFPIKAKYFVLLYAAAELFMGVGNLQQGVAHFAHLGGALFGFLMVKYWNKTNRNSLY